MSCRDEAEYLNNPQQGKTQAMRAGSNLLRDKSGFRCSFSSHFQRLYGYPAKVTNDTKSHLVPRAEQNKPVLIDRGRPGKQRCQEEHRAVRTSSSRAHAAPRSSPFSAVLSTIAEAPLDAAGSLTACPFLLSTPSQALSTAWRI